MIDPDIELRTIPKAKHATTEYIYYCWIYPEAALTAEDRERGTCIYPFPIESGGTGGPAFYIVGLDDLIAFARQADVILYMFFYRPSDEVDREQEAAQNRP